MNDVTFGKHYLPHDVNVRELGSGRSRKELLRSLGVRVTTVRRLGKGDQIEAVRAVLPRCWFGKKECSMGIEHLKGYRKEWDEQKQVFRKTPVHDKCSHGADAFATLAVGLKDTSRSASANAKDRTEYKVKELSW
jgi:phage terminase large subunit